MAFVGKNLYSATGNSGVAQNIFTYKTADPRLTVETTGYFNDARGVIKENDYIYVRGVEDYMLRVVSTLNATIETELLHYLTGLGQTTGWVEIVDQTYTTGAPLQLTSTVRTPLNLNADVVRDTQAPFGTDISTFYDIATSKIFAEREGDYYNLRFTFNARPAAAGTNLEFEIDIGAKVFKAIKELSRGAVEDVYVAALDYEAGSGLVETGGEIYVKASGAVDLFDMAIAINRTHRGF